MHQEVIDFCQYVKTKHPEYFKGKTVLDVGSLDINGTNRYLFEDCSYTGLDLFKGKNVDIVCPVHKFNALFDVVICTEMLEHDQYWLQSLQNMRKICKGLLIITAAGMKRHIHGTKDKTPQDSPFTNDYYRNVSTQMLIDGLAPDLSFKEFEITEPRNQKDICFYGVYPSSNNLSPVSSNI